MISSKGNLLILLSPFSRIDIGVSMSVGILRLVGSGEVGAVREII